MDENQEKKNTIWDKLKEFDPDFLDEHFGELPEPAEPNSEFVDFTQEAAPSAGTDRGELPTEESSIEMPHVNREKPLYDFDEEYTSNQKESSPWRDGFDDFDDWIVPRKPFWKRSSFWKKTAAVMLLVSLVMGSCAVTAHLVNQRWEERVQALQNEFSQQLEELESRVGALSPAATGESVSGTVNLNGGYTAAQVYAQNVESVVMIESTIVSSFYGQSSTGISSGSGFILTEDGYVITNYHVIEGASSVSVIMVDGKKYSAEVVGFDSTNDVAVLKIDAQGLNPVTLGSSDDLIVGDQVVAIGNPLGSLTSTLTVGYVSAKERNVSTDGTLINMIQTDAAINSGNSGGPLFNMKGEVVGITTAKYSGASSSGATIEGIGFAIPISDVTEEIDELINYGYIKSAYMGVVVQNMDTSVAAIYSLPVGAYVVSVEEGGPAQRAGIQEKDIIVAVGDRLVENLTDLTLALREYEPGDVALVTIYRGGVERTVRVTLTERPADAG